MMVAWDNTNNEVGKDGKRHSSSHSMSAISIDSDPGGRMRSYIAPAIAHLRSQRRRHERKRLPIKRR